MLVLTFFDAATQSMEFDDQCDLFCSLFEKNSNLYPHLLSVKKHKAITYYIKTGNLQEFNSKPRFFSPKKDCSTWKSRFCVVPASDGTDLLVGKGADGQPDATRVYASTQDAFSLLIELHQPLAKNIHVPNRSFRSLQEELYSIIRERYCNVPKSVLRYFLESCPRCDLTQIRKVGAMQYPSSVHMVWLNQNLVVMSHQLVTFT